LESSLAPLGFRDRGQPCGDHLLEAIAKPGHRDPFQNLTGEGEG